MGFSRSLGLFLWALIFLWIGNAEGNGLNTDFLSKWIPTNAPPFDTKAFLQEIRKRYSYSTSPLVPVVIIPSLIGTQLEIKLENAETNHWWCFKNSDWYSLWVNKNQFLPGVVDCWKDNMMLTYNNNTYGLPNGIDVRVVGFGGVDGVAYLDPEHTIPCWNVTIEVLKDLGYTVGQNLRAASYDWRIGADGLGQQFELLKQLIEETYEINNQSKVATVSLSMGTTYFMNFLNQYVNQAWKDRFIHSFTSWSGPFGGSTYAATSLIALEPGIFPSSLISPEKLRDLQQTLGSLVWLLPTRQVFGDQAYLTTPNGNFSPENIIRALEAVNASKAIAMLKNMDPLRNSQSPPGIRMNCVYGYNISTLATFTLDSNSKIIDATMSDGDGTVLHAGLSLCDSWADSTNSMVKVYQIPNMIHGNAVANPTAIRIFLDTILGVF